MSQPVFAPGVNVHGESITFLVDEAPIREQQRGNHKWETALTVENCVVLINTPTTGLVGTRTGIITQEGLLYAPRGSAIANNMRFWYRGMWFGIIAPPRFDFDHVLTGENFGYAEYVIIEGGTA
jgi:hypothetical protein